jgi:hypothetical protein
MPDFVESVCAVIGLTVVVGIGLALFFAIKLLW